MRNRFGDFGQGSLVCSSLQSRHRQGAVAGNGFPQDRLRTVSGGLPRATAPLVLGTVGAGFVEDANGSALPVGARVMFTGAYGVAEDGAYREYLAVRKENLSSIPGNSDDVSAAGLPLEALVGRAPSPARRPLPPLPAAGRERPAQTRGSAPPGRCRGV